MSDARDYEDAYLRNDGDYKQQRCPHGWVDIKQCRDCDNIKEIESLRQQLKERDKHIAALRKALIKIHESLDALNDTEPK